MQFYSCVNSFAQYASQYNSCGRGQVGGESGTKDENGANLKQTLLSLRLSPIWGELVQFQANSATLSSPLSTMAVSSSATYPVHLLTSRFSFYDLKTLVKSRNLMQKSWKLRPVQGGMIIHLTLTEWDWHLLFQLGSAFTQLWLYFKKR